MRQELEFLKHETHLLPQSRHTSTVKLSHVLTVDDYSAFGRFFFPEEQFQQGRFSRAARPGQKNQLPRRYLQIDVLKSCSVRRVYFRDMRELDHEDVRS